MHLLVHGLEEASHFRYGSFEYFVLCFELFALLLIDLNFCRCLHLQLLPCVLLCVQLCIELLLELLEFACFFLLEEQLGSLFHDLLIQLIHLGD